MFQLLKKKLFKRKTLNKIQNQIWQLEMGFGLQIEFLREAKENKESILRKIKIEQDFVDGLKESTKYEDRQKRKTAEETIARYRKVLEEQIKQIEVGGAKKEANLQRIDDLIKQRNFIKAEF